MLEKGSTEGIDVGVWVFNFTNGAENGRNNFETSSGEVANIVILDVFVSELLQMHESGISVSEDSVSVPRNNSTFA